MMRDRQGTAALVVMAAVAAAVALVLPADAEETAVMVSCLLFLGSLMFDPSPFPSRPGVDVQVYNPTTAVNVGGFQTWRKPAGVSMVEMIAISGGGGGGGGFSRAAGSAGGGGAGGACSGIARFLVPATFLPDTLYIQVGSGGQGGAASANGNAGLNSFVLTSKTAVLPNIVCYSGVNAPGGGGAGTGAAGGTGGTVPTIAVIQPINTLGIWFAIDGVVGAAGGAQTGANGVDITSWSGTRIIAAGCGGAGCTTTDFNGGRVGPGAVTDIGNQTYYINAAAAIAAGGTGGTGVAVNGSSGPKRLTPFFNAGGAGGGSNNVGQAGHGGTGGYGCGGGGGGAGTTGGRGGNGGPGLVVITSW